MGRRASLVTAKKNGWRREEDTQVTGRVTAQNQGHPGIPGGIYRDTGEERVTGDGP